MGHVVERTENAHDEEPVHPCSDEEKGRPDERDAAPAGVADEADQHDQYPE